jgi:segregation and condensation protein B
MSLKAKIEAVIYASEEPVTLAQLVGLLGQEAQAELDRAATAQQTLLMEEELAAEVAGPSVGPAFDAVGDGSTEMAESATPASVPESDEPPSDASSTGEEAYSQAESAHSNGAPAQAASGSAEAAAGRAERARAAKLRGYFRATLDGLIAEYAAPESDRGLEIREVAGGFKFATKPEYHDAVRGFVKSLKPPLKLSLQALETLAVVAYKQPVTAPEISEIRGVESSGVLGSLMMRKLITTAGRKQVIGRPFLYKTTKEFLLKFGLRDVAELPSIEEFEKMAGQMAEQEDIPMGDTAGPHDAPENVAELEEERETHEPQPDGEVEAADNVSEETGDKASVDGRTSSLPPDYAAEELRDDPSAQEAEIQSGGEK